MDVGLGQHLQYGGTYPVTSLSPTGTAVEEVVVLLCSPDSSEEKALGAVLPCILS